MIRGNEELTFKRCLAEVLENTVVLFDNLTHQMEEQLQAENDNDLYFCKKVLSGTVTDNLNEIVKKLKESDK